MKNEKYLAMMLEVVSPWVTGYFVQDEQRELLLEIIRLIKEWDRKVVEYKTELVSMIPIGEEDGSYNGAQAINAGCCILCALEYMETGEERSIEEFDQHYVEIIHAKVWLRLMSIGVADVSLERIARDHEFVAGMKLMEQTKNQCI